MELSCQLHPLPPRCSRDYVIPVRHWVWSSLVLINISWGHRCFCASSESEWFLDSWEMPSADPSENSLCLYHLRSAEWFRRGCWSLCWSINKTTFGWFCNCKHWQWSHIDPLLTNRVRLLHDVQIHQSVTWRVKYAINSSVIAPLNDPMEILFGQV